MAWLLIIHKERGVLSGNPEAVSHDDIQTISIKIYFEAEAKIRLCVQKEFCSSSVPTSPMLADVQVSERDIRHEQHRE